MFMGSCPVQRELMNVLELPLLAPHSRFTAPSHSPARTQLRVLGKDRPCLSPCSWASSSFPGSETLQPSPSPGSCLTFPQAQLLLAQLPQPSLQSPPSSRAPPAPEPPSGNTGSEGPAQGPPQPLVASSL